MFTFGPGVLVLAWRAVLGAVAWRGGCRFWRCWWWAALVLGVVFGRGSCGLFRGRWRLWRGGGGAAFAVGAGWEAGGGAAGVVVLAGLECGQDAVVADGEQAGYPQ